MNIAWITVLYNTPQKQIQQLTKEISSIDPSIQLIIEDNSHNGKGYAFGVNKGIEKAVQLNADYVIISNPDISVSSLRLEEMVEGAKHFDVWGFSFKQDARIYYGGELDKWKMSGGLLTTTLSQRFVECDFVSGSLMMVKREVIEKVGLWDESFEMYYEDVDFCIRAKRAGFKVGIDTKCMYEHFETSDTNPKKKEYLAKNRKRILWKYGSWKQKIYEIISTMKFL